MYEQITAWELDCLINYTPDREPTAQELQQIEQQELPTRHELIYFKQFVNWMVVTQRQPMKKIIIEKQINKGNWYERIIFNDWETIRELTPLYPKPIRLREKELKIKILSTLAELYQDVRLINKQLKRIENITDRRQAALSRIKIREVLRSTRQEINQYDKRINKLRGRSRTY